MNGGGSIVGKGGKKAMKGSRKDGEGMHKG